jgi:hypothetical protein
LLVAVLSPKLRLRWYCADFTGTSLRPSECGP